MVVCELRVLVTDAVPVGLATMLLFFWRKKRRAREEDSEKASRNEDQGSAKAKTWYRRAKDSKRELHGDERVERGEAWLYVGKDEDGTPFYVDTQSVVCDPANPVAASVWVKYKPSQTSQSFQSAQGFLTASGKDGGKLDHIRQRLQIDYSRKEIGDLELRFCEADGRVMESVKYRSVEWKSVPPRGLYDLVWRTVDGIWRSDRLPFEPELRAKIQEKLWEINKAFESFETASPESEKGG